MRNRAKISQVEAMKWKKKAIQLQSYLDDLRCGWLKSWPGQAVPIARIRVDDKSLAIADTAKRLKHCVLVTVDGDNLVLWGERIDIPQ